MPLLKPKFVWRFTALSSSSTCAESKLDAFAPPPRRFGSHPFYCALLALFLGPFVVYGSEAPKPEEGGGETAPVTSKESIEYNKKEARLNTLRARIDEANKRFEQLIKAKNHSHDNATKQSLAEEMVSIDKERKQNQAELTALKQEIEYQHPNKGKEIDKKLKTGERKSNEALEHATGLDEKLNEVKRRVDKKYKPLIPKEDLEAEAAQKAKVETPEPTKKLRLEK